MDTFVTISLYAPDEQTAQAAFDDAFSEISRIESQFSIFIDSPIKRLNDDGYLNSPSPEIIKLFRDSQYYHTLSLGSFDITVQPILDLYKTSFSDNKQPPNFDEVSRVLVLVDSNNIIIENSSIYLANKGMKVTFGAIAKGYAVDRAVEVLRKHTISSALVNIGGNARGFGRKDNGELWTVALENPRNKGDYLSLIYLDDKSVATSGDYERYFNENKSFHHIVNPNTGYSATDCISATVVAPTGEEADGLSTSVFVMCEKGIQMVEELDGVEALIVLKNRTIIKSSGYVW